MMVVLRLSFMVTFDQCGDTMARPLCFFLRWPVQRNLFMTLCSYQASAKYLVVVTKMQNALSCRRSCDQEVVKTFYHAFIRPN